MNKDLIKKLFFIVVILTVSSWLLTFSYESQNNYNSKSFFSKDCLNDYKEFAVTAVCDGDTISLTNCKNDQKENKIRFLGIDAFEHGQEPFATLGKKFLTDLVLNKKVCIETDVNEKDIYERTLGYVFLNEVTARSVSDEAVPIGIATPHFIRLAMTSNLIFINEEILKNGHAILYDFPPNIKYIEKLKKAQIYARENMIGVWKDSDHIKETPYQHRHKKQALQNKL